MAKAQAATMTDSLMDSAKRFGGDLRQTGRDVFLAGLGVVAATEEEARGFFDRMVDKGKTYEQDEDRLFGKAAHEFKELGERLEERVRKSVTTTLNRAGVPSRDEIQRLTERVEVLTRKVDQLASK